MSRFLSNTSKKLVPYTPGEQPKQRKFIKLNTNENPYPPSPKVAEALMNGVENDMPKEISDLRLYSDPEEKVLVDAIAAYYNVKPTQVVCGNGSDENIAFAFKAFCDKDMPITFADLTYSFYPSLCALYEIPYNVIPLEADFTIDPEKYYNLGTTIIIANPNAPTGIFLPLDKIEDIAKHNPDNVVIVDEAYVDFGGQSAVTLLDKCENIVVTQTFSKSRSLAGARIGFAIANEALANDMNTVRNSGNPYNINRLSILAGAAAISDREYTEECCKKVMATRAMTIKGLREMGFDVCDSCTNFLFAESDKISGLDYYTKLRENGILVRRWSAPRLENRVRISIGTDEEMETFLRVTQEILSSTPQK